MMRDAPAELDNTFAGPYGSTIIVSNPARTACHAIQEPNTPAPAIATRFTGAISTGSIHSASPHARNHRGGSVPGPGALVAAVVHHLPRPRVHRGDRAAHAGEPSLP